MTKKLKIRRIGNGQGVTLTKETLNRIGVGMGDELHLVHVPGGVQLTRYDPDFDHALDAATDFMRRYPNAMRKLAEG